MTEVQLASDNGICYVIDPEENIEDFVLEIIR